MYENLDYLNIENTNTNEDLKNYNKNIKYNYLIKIRKYITIKSIKLCKYFLLFYQKI